VGGEGVRDGEVRESRTETQGGEAKVYVKEKEGAVVICLGAKHSGFMVCGLSTRRCIPRPLLFFLLFSQLASKGCVRMRRFPLFLKGACKGDICLLAQNSSNWVR
jgi:hypothetical protein